MTQLPAPQTTITDTDLDNLLTEHKANYEVAVVPTPNPFGGAPTGFFTSYRTDTNKIFQQGLSKQWHPIQNRESLKVITELSKVTDVKLRHLYMFGEGKELCAQLDLGHKDLGNGDKVSNFISMINDHGGGHSMSIFSTPFRWFCENQINHSIEQAKANKAMISLRHTTSAKEKLELLIDAITKSHINFKESIELYTKMLNTPVKTSMATDIIEAFFPIDEKSEKRGTTIRKNKISDVQNRFFSADQGRTQRDTAWNLYNSVQGHLQHYGKNTESHQKSILIGPDAKRAAQAMLTILSITASQHLANALVLSQEEKKTFAL